MSTPDAPPADAVRTLAIDLRVNPDVPIDDRGRIPVVFSSEYAVERYDAWADERYLEVLDHSRDAVDMSRAAKGLPFLDSHELRAQLGRVENITQREDGKLAGWLRFSKRAAAQEYRQDILDGIRGEVSVGYRIDPEQIDVETRAGVMPTYRVKRWMPFEVSGVSVPADPTVGAFRSGVAAPNALPRPVVTTRAEPVVAPVVVPSTTTTTAPHGEERAMDVNETTAAPAGATVVVTRQDGESPESESRRRSVAQLAAQHAVEDVFARGMSEGKDLDLVQRDMMQALRERAASGPKFEGRVQLSEKEEKQYSFARAILAADSGEKCFEREVSEELSRKLPQGYNPKGSGLFVPTNLGQRTALSSATSSLGGASVFTQAGSFIDLLRNKAFVIQAGATVLPGLSAPVSFPKQNGAGTAYWVAEASGSDVTESNVTFALVTLSPKTVAGTQAFSRQLLVQASSVANIEQLVRNDLAQIHALAIDAAAIAGTGTNQPLGITKSTAVGTVTMGSAGAVPTYEALVDQEVQIRAGNVDGGLAYITTPGIAGKLKKTQKFATTNGEAVWTGDLVNGTLNGASAYATNQVPSNLTKGTATTVCHAIIAGAFANLLVGEFGMAEIITDPFAKKKQGMIEVTSFQMVDVAWRHDAAFSVILDAKTA